jgi:hypothetical protein
MSPTTTASPRTPRVLVIAAVDPAAAGPAALAEVAAAVAGREALVVAPAGPVAGERWVVDLTARAVDAHERAAAWAAALAPHAAGVRGEAGDASPRLAAEDARRAFGPDHVLLVVPRPAPRGRGLPARRRVTAAWREALTAGAARLVVPGPAAGARA